MTRSPGSGLPQVYSPAAEGVAEGSEGLVREGLRLGGRHAGLGVPAQAGQQRQDPRPLEPCLDIQAREPGPQLHRPRQVGGFGVLPDPDSGPACGVNAD